MTATLVIADGDSLRHKWGWFLGLGIVMILLGTIALVIMPAASLATVIVLGWLMAFSGVFEAIHAFQVRGWRGVLLHLVAGLLGIVLGLLIVTHPVAGALAWTMLIAVIFSRGRNFPDGGGDSNEVSQLGLGSLRRGYHTTAGHSFMGRLAVVGTVVSRPFDWNLTGTAWMGAPDVGVRSARSLHYECGPASRSLNGIEACKTNF